MSIAIIIGVLVVLPGLYIGAPWYARNRLRSRFLKKVARSSGYAITFDDGPDPEATPCILDILKRYDAHATFFVLGEQVQRNSALLKRILSEGHEVGLHSYRHRHPWLTGPVGSVLDLIRGTQSLTQYIRSEPLLFRPPYGKVNLASLLYIWLKKVEVVFWDIDPQDYLTSSADEVYNRVGHKLSAGRVLLLHDGRDDKQFSSKEVTISALERILREARKKKIIARTVSDMLCESLENQNITGSP